MLDGGDLGRFLRPRSRNSHKGESGRVLCVGGGHGSGGAVMLCAEAALRSGAGLVDVATRAAHVHAMLSRRPEAMAHAVDAAADLDGLVDVADVVAIGPGLGQDAWGDELFSALIDNAKPLVVDADALNIPDTTPRKPQPDPLPTPPPGTAPRPLSTTTHDGPSQHPPPRLALVERFA